MVCTSCVVVDEYIIGRKEEKMVACEATFASKGKPGLQKKTKYVIIMLLRRSLKKKKQSRRKGDGEVW